MTLYSIYDPISRPQLKWMHGKYPRGMSLIVDYGEPHSFSNSFRGLKQHKLVKDDQEILDNIGNIDLTTYVNF